MPKFTLNKSLLGQGISFGLLLLFLMQIPLAITSYHYLQTESQKKNEFYRNAVEELLVGVFKDQALYGDIVNSRGGVLKQGEKFGLVGLGVCKDGVDVLPKMDDDRCSSQFSHKEVEIFEQRLTLAFNWDQRNSVTIRNFIVPLITSLVISALLLMLIIFLISKKLSHKVGEVSLEISKLSDLNSLGSVKTPIRELRPLEEALQKLKNNLAIKNQENIDLKISDKIAQVAKQVAHDIRSPLAALESFLGGGSEQLAKDSVERIREIADDLLGENRAIRRENILVAEELKTIVDHKKAEVPNYKLKLNVESTHTDIRVRVNGPQFRRIISNLINNAIEASEAESQITIATELRDQNILIIVEDEGIGMSEELVQKIGLEEISMGKSGGNGIAVKAAMREAQKWSGGLRYESTLGVGTRAILFIPILRDREFVLLDNDELVRLNWKLRASEVGVQLTTFESWSELKDSLEAMSKETIFYIDSDLGNGVQGEELARSLCDQGWRDVNLCTGRSADEFEHLDYIRDVIDKSPPF